MINIVIHIFSSVCQTDILTSRRNYSVFYGLGCVFCCNALVVQQCLCSSAVVISNICCSNTIMCPVKCCICRRWRVWVISLCVRRWCWHIVIDTAHYSTSIRCWQQSQINMNCWNCWLVHLCWRPTVHTTLPCGHVQSLSCLAMESLSETTHITTHHVDATYDKQCRGENASHTNHPSYNASKQRAGTIWLAWA